MTKSLEQRENERVEEINSAKFAISHILKLGKEVSLKHKKKLLDEMIWKITEADGFLDEKRTGYKYKTSYISREVKNRRDSGNESSDNLIQEHVYKRKNLVKELLDNPKSFELVLENAIGCVVTLEEHEKLHRIQNKNCDGWERYKQAKIDVYKRSPNGEFKLFLENTK